MKKMLSILLFGGALLSTTLAPALAEVYSYKVYDPKTNKSYTAEIRPAIIGGKSYLTEFYTLQGKPLCFFGSKTNTNNQGLVGGECQDSSSMEKIIRGQQNIKPYTMGWREINKNTFYREIESLRQEMIEQGIKPLY